MILKRIAAILFGISFLMAIVLFTNIGADIISKSIAKIVFLIVGSLALLLNLLSFRFGKHDANFNFFYWLGSLIIFIGLTFMIMHWPNAFYIVIGGMTIVGISFIYSPKIDGRDSEKSDLLDDDL
ncbi:MAG: hypothetical protein RI883_664 [Bacteroidota bacterium]|jgi:drug/metabolite transporter (DMT)-like permease